MTTASIDNPISIPITAARKAIPISLILHALLLVGLYYADWLDREAGDARPRIPEYVEVKLTERPVVIQTVEAENPAPLTKPVPKAEPKAQASSGLARLLKQSNIQAGAIHPRSNAPDLSQVRYELEKTAAKGLPVLDSSATQGIRGALAKAHEELVQGKFNWGAIESVSESNSNSGADISLIVSTLAKYQNEFRECYERALFVDSGLSGKAQFLISISQSGDVDSSKVAMHLGSTQSQAAPGLKSCLESVGKKVHFPSTVGQQSVQFGLLLRS